MQYCADILADSNAGEEGGPTANLGMVAQSTNSYLNAKGVEKVFSAISVVYCN
jgi:hypothetical protein